MKSRLFFVYLQLVIAIFFMSKFTFNLVLPSWLAQWFINHYGGQLPVRLAKGSIESIIVQRFSMRKTDAESVDISSEGSVQVEIPDSKTKPAASYCFIPDHAKKLIAKSISDNFNMCLAEDIVKPCFPVSLKKELIEAWLEHNNIEFNDTNYQGVEKRFDRLRKDMLNARRVRKARKKLQKFS